MISVLLKFMSVGIPIVAQQLRIQLSVHEDVGSTPDLAQWVKNSALLQLQCRLQMQLRSFVAMAVA